MKRKKFISFSFSLVLILLPIQILFSQQGWYWRNPLPQGNDLKSIKFINSSTGYSVGKCGTILKTSNGGSSWIILNSNTSSDLNCCDFVNAETGYAVGYPSTIIKTVNGGLNWTLLNFNIPNSQLLGVSFINATTGIVTYDGVLIYKTTNGGQTWYYYSTGLGSGEIYSVQMVDSASVYASGFHTVFKSSNGGINWTLFSPGLRDYYQIHFDNLMSGMVVGSGGHIFLTTDSGISWLNKSQNDYLNFRSVFKIDQNVAYICGDTVAGLYGIFYKTTNGGDNWSKIRINAIDSTALLNRVSFYGIDTGIVVGNSGVTALTTNGGNNWHAISYGSIRDVEDIQILDSTLGFAIGNRSALKSTNGGETWFSITNPGIVCKALFFIDENTGFIGGNYNMARTTNSGINWISYAVPSSGSIYDLYFHNAASGFAVGRNGMILSTTNGGVNWITKPTPTSNHLYEVCFMDVLTGYVAGYNGTILKTTNGGNEWILIRNIAGQHLYAMDFFDKDTLIAVGRAGLITKTSNGGLNWDTLVSGTTKDLNGVKHFGENGWIAAGNEGVVVSTTNSGTNWCVQPHVTKNYLLSIYIRDTNIYISGQYGTILCSSPGSIITNMKSQISNVANKFVLYQNYPNPFNPLTKIKFEIPVNIIPEGMVQLKIYNILGEEVEELFNGRLHQGSYEFLWNASNMPSGIYFCRLSSGNVILVRKMVLVK